MTYNIKVQLPSVKKGDAVDIDTLGEYKISLLRYSKPVLPKSMYSLIWRTSRDVGRGSHSDDDDEDPELYDADRLSDLDWELARLRGMLEKKYQNSNNAGYTYIDPSTATTYPLTPQMMKEWCRAMYDGKATLNEPPSFIAAGINGPAVASVPAQGMSDIGYLANILTTVMGGRNGVADVTNPAALPKTPVRETKEKTNSSLICPTPSKLPRFLEHAVTNLGVPSAPTFESPMRRNGFGPDILHLVEDRDLTDLGIKKGDVIRMKAGAQEWWNGPNAKKKRSHADMEAMSASASGSSGLPDALATPPSKKVSFERHYEDGGASRFYGPRIKPGEGAKNVFYCCPLRNKFVLIPLRYQCTHEEEYVSDDEDTKAEAVDLYNPPDFRLETQRRDDAAEALVSLKKS
ncbi:hypothetical protein C8R45DRAFT_1134350 [Mycena sanguinolenta]|nr:hypothetical protein C8R45DRAFT_1134350 [Mycena sanguinolenta]